MTGGCVSLLHGNALSIPLADQSVHLIISSPPYFSLRSYRDGDEHFDGQLGSEATPHHFLAALWAVMDECWRVLRDDGSCWINLGDKMAGSSSGSDNGALTTSGLVGTPSQRLKIKRHGVHSGDLRAKCRMLLPHRFALGLIDPEYRQWTEHRAGITPTVDPPQWICRMDVVQSKVNGLPESVNDRVRASHETWFHLTKSERYFASMDEIREEQTWGRQINPEWRKSREDWSDGAGAGARHGRDGGLSNINALGKLPGSVWEWANEPLILPPDLPQHFAAFSSWPVKRIVLGWSPSGVCVACGQPLRPVTTKTGQRPVARNRRHIPGYADPAGEGVRDMTYEITNYQCDCEEPWTPEQLSAMRITATGRTTAPTISTTKGMDAAVAECQPMNTPVAIASRCLRPSVVLDPFSGTGTAPIVAAALGRHGIGVDLSWDYHRIARWRDGDGGLRAKALGVDKPPKQVAGQGSLFDESAA